jgi:hypothetical protein
MTPEQYTRRYAIMWSWIVADGELMFTDSSIQDYV